MADAKKCNRRHHNDNKCWMYYYVCGYQIICKKKKERNQPNISCYNSSNKLSEFPLHHTHFVRITIILLSHLSFLNYQ